jgi:hypothetical protein
MDFTCAEYTDMHFIYGEMHGNTEAARRRHAERFPNRRLPNRQTFQYVHRLLREDGTFRPQRVDAGRNVAVEQQASHC